MPVPVPGSWRTCSNRSLIVPETSHAVVCFFMGCGKVWKARQREDLRRQRDGSWWCLDDDVGWSDFRLLGSGFELPDSRYWMALEVMGLGRVCRGSV